MLLRKDSEMSFPDFVVVRASAGSGKTHALTKRFVQFILSDVIPNNNLNNILAVTFSNNAAKEMKDRIISWLKEIYFLNESKINELKDIINFEIDNVKTQAENKINEILDNYSDFQVKTIDSFMASILRASALDLGYNTDFEILMDSNSVFNFAFDMFLKEVDENSYVGEFLNEIIKIISSNRSDSSSYLWDPSENLLTEIIKLHRKISSKGKNVVYEDLSIEMNELKERINDKIIEIEQQIKENDLDVERTIKCGLNKMPGLVENGNYSKLFEIGLKLNPLKKYKGKDETLKSIYATINEELWPELVSYIHKYAELYSRTYFNPYIQTYNEFERVLEKVKKQQGKIFIEDVNKKLSNYLDKDIVPDIYFRLGNTIFHYLIDEFQDTSPIQHKNLYPLIENILAQKGSLFVVGDTKQAIYGFRDADYKIMRDYELYKSQFPSVKQEVRELNFNYRSYEQVVNFNNEMFKKVIPSNEKYKYLAEQNGLSDFNQQVRPDKTDKGIVSIRVVEKDKEEPLEQDLIYNAIDNAIKKGYSLKDIAILTSKNDSVVNIASWLNNREPKIDFISYSNLDIRKRKITGEILSLLAFLNSPPDDLSFVTFCLGKIFIDIMAKDSDFNISLEELRTFLFDNRKIKKKKNPPVYRSFQRDFLEIWNKYFEKLFNSVGYLPLYDLVTEIYRTFNLFDLLGNEEEATLVKILEVIKEFEESESNNLKDFLEYASNEGDADSKWNISIPKNIDAVRIMTIHKSKGLGFPVVIVVLYEERQKGFDYIVNETDEGIELLKITSKMKLNENSDLLSLYQDEKNNATIDSLNKLYVVLTRAKQIMHVIGVKNVTKSNKPGYPLNLLEDKDFKGKADFDENEIKTSDDTKQLYNIRHHIKEINKLERVSNEINYLEKQRGDVVHKILSRIKWLKTDEIEECIKLAIKDVLISEKVKYDSKQLFNTLFEFLRESNILDYFTKIDERIVNIEQEYVTQNGEIFRMDRVIIDKDKVTVIDYKTGNKDKEKSYKNQVVNYMNILKEIYLGKTIEGYLAYVDLSELRRI